MSAERRARGNLVEALSSALDQGSHGLANAPALLRRILEEESWREFETQRGDEVRHERFVDFVVTPPLKGLGASIELVRRIVANDAVATDLLDRANQSQHGGDRSKVDIVNLAQPDGNSRATALRRLRKDAPELHEEVLAGRLTAHAAMVQAGFRKKTVSVPVSDVAAAARALRRNLGPEDLAALVEELSKP